MSIPRFLRRGREPNVTVADPRFEDWETVSTFEDETTGLAWRDQLRTGDLLDGDVQLPVGVFGF